MLTRCFPAIGAFGSGAAFALEDGWILARAIEHVRSISQPLSKALDIFDSVRSPYYHRMLVQSIRFSNFFDGCREVLNGWLTWICRYEFLDEQKKNILESKARNPDQSFEASLKARVKAFGGEEDMAWIYRNDIEEVWRKYLDGDGGII